MKIWPHLMDIRPSSLTSLSSLKGPSKKSTKDKTNAFDPFSDTSETPSSSPIQHDSLLLSIDPLFALIDQPSSREKIVKTSEDLLDGLDFLKRQLLTGRVSYETLHILKNKIDELHQDQLDDDIKELIREIETRACVEIAKLKMSR